MAEKHVGENLVNKASLHNFRFLFLSKYILYRGGNGQTTDECLRLLIRRNRSNEYEFAIFQRSDHLEQWQGISGGVEDDETLMQAALREAFEEAGTPLDSKLFRLDTVSYLPSNIFAEHERWGDDVLVCPMYFFAMHYEGEVILSALLSKHGMKLSEKTPDFSTEEIKRTRKFSLVKAQEILAWLKMHINVENYVVLDDLDLNNDEVRKHQIKPDGSNGLSNEDAEKAIQALRSDCY